MSRLVFGTTFAPLVLGFAVWASPGPWFVCGRLARIWTLEPWQHGLRRLGFGHDLAASSSHPSSCPCCFFPSKASTCLWEEMILMPSVALLRAGQSYGNYGFTE